MILRIKTVSGSARNPGDSPWGVDVAIAHNAVDNSTPATSRCRLRASAAGAGNAAIDGPRDARVAGDVDRGFADEQIESVPARTFGSPGLEIAQQEVCLALIRW